MYIIYIYIYKQKFRIYTHLLSSRSMMTQGSGGESIITTQRNNTKTEKYLTYIGWLLITIYLWTLPAFASYFSQNDNIEICTTPASKIECKRGNYSEITGLEYGCGCGQGIFGQHVCPVDSWGFSISSFIVSGPATALFVTLCILPIRSLWLYVLSSISQSLESGIFHITSAAITCIWASLVAFTLLFIGVLTATLCISSWIHAILVICFLSLSFSLFLILIYLHNEDEEEVHIIILVMIMTLVSTIGFAVSGITFSQELHDYPYLTWIFESAAITFFTSLPYLVILSKSDGEKIDIDDIELSDSM